MSLKELRDTAVTNQFDQYLKNVDQACVESAKAGQSYIEIWITVNDCIAGDESVSFALEIPPNICGGHGNAGKLVLPSDVRAMEFIKKLYNHYVNNDEVTMNLKTEDGFRDKIVEEPKTFSDQQIIELHW